MLRIGLVLLSLFSGIAAAQVVTPPGLAPDFSGETKVAVVLANFSDTPTSPVDRRFDQADIDTITAQMFGPGPSISDLFEEMSFGVDRLVGSSIDVLGPVTIDSTGYDGSTVCSFGSLNTWRQEAIAEIHETSPGLLEQGNAPGNQLVAVFMSERNDCDNANSINGGAFRMISGLPGPNGLAAVVMSNWRTAQTAAHEIGHLKGWRHSELEGYMGYQKGYGDHSCVMADNYIYNNHPEYLEYNSDPEGPAVLLQMRQANAPQKIHAGYIAQTDLFETPDSIGISTVYLAPTQVAGDDFPDPPAGSQMWHAAVVDIPILDDIYIVSYRAAHDENGNNEYDSNPMFDHLMGRIHVHSFPRANPDFPVRRANLSAGGSFSDGVVEVRAITDGQGSEPFVEIEIEYLPYSAPDLQVDAQLAENNTTAQSGAFPIVVTNTGPAGSSISDFGFSIANADPIIVGATFTPPTVTLGPDESGTVDIVLQFSGPPAEGSYPFDLTVSDTVNPRPATTVGTAYVNDFTAPSITNLVAEHEITRVRLNWDEDQSTDTYDVTKNGATLINGVTEPTILDLAVSVTDEPVYEVRAIDAAGNAGPWSQVTAIYPCKTPPLLSMDPKELTTSSLPASATLPATVTNDNPAGCPDFHYGLSSPSGVPGGWLFSAGGVTIPAQSSDTIDVTVLNEPFQNPSPAEQRFSLTLRATDPNGIASSTLGGVFFTYDRTDPSPPAGLQACLSNAGVDLSWSAAVDNVGIADYDVFGDSGYLATTTATAYQDPAPKLDYDVQAFDYVGQSATASTSTAFPTVSIDPIVTNQPSPSIPIQVTNHNGLGCAAATFDLTPASGNVSVPPTVTIDSQASSSVIGTLNETQEGFYLYGVNAQGSLGTGTVTLDLTPPTAPSNLGAAESGGSVSLTWDAATDAMTSVASYDVFRDGAPIGSTAGLSLTDGNPPSASAISYEVRAVDAAGNQGAGDVWTISIGGISKDFSVCNQTTISWTTTESVPCSLRYRVDGTSTWSSPYATPSGGQHAVTVPTARNTRYETEVSCIAESTFIVKTPKYCIGM